MGRAVMTCTHWDTEVAVLIEALQMLRDGRESQARDVFDRLAVTAQINIPRPDPARRVRDLRHQSHVSRKRLS